VPSTVAVTTLRSGATYETAKVFSDDDVRVVEQHEAEGAALIEHDLCVMLLGAEQ
jgi:hypothetical protein